MSVVCIVWTVYEQVFIAALDEHDQKLADKCLTVRMPGILRRILLTKEVIVCQALKQKFPSSARVGRLEGMLLVGSIPCGPLWEVYTHRVYICRNNVATLQALTRSTTRFYRQTRQMRSS
jgi:hypothetical protein